MNPYCLTPQGLDSRGVQLDFHFLLQQARGLSYVESKKLSEITVLPGLPASLASFTAIFQMIRISQLNSATMKSAI